MSYTISGGFSGGTVTGATTFDSAVTFNDTILLPGSVDTNDILTIAAGDNTADRTLTLTAGTNLGLSLDSGSFSFSSVVDITPNGTAATPVLRNASDTDTGLNFGSDLIYFNVAGVQAANIQSFGGVRYFVMTEAAAVIQINDNWLFRPAQGVLGIGYNGKTGAGQVSLDQANGHRIAAKQVTLTEAGGAETVVTITTTAGQMTGGRIAYTVRATDGTDFAVRSGSFGFACVNAATVVTAALSQPDATGGAVASEADDGSILVSTNSKTLTYAIAADVATANALKITFNIDSDMTVNAASITWTCILNGPGTVA